MTAPHDDQPSRDMGTLNAALRDLRSAERIASLESIIAGLTIRAEQAEYRLQHANAACARVEAERGKLQAESSAWRELSRRLYIELFYCDQQMRETKRRGKPIWSQGATVRDVLADAKAALESRQEPAAAPAQTEPTDIEHEGAAA